MSAGSSTDAARAPRRRIEVARSLVVLARPPHQSSWRLDSLLMESRDRVANLGVFGAAALAWLLVAFVITARDPSLDPAAGFVGAILIGVAVGLTTVPLFWLSVFARHRRIAYRGDWLRAARRGAWVAVVVAVLVVLRLQGLFQPQIALFILVMVFVAEATLSVER
jgi:hypothetical protein